MITLDQLKPFCGTDDTREVLQQPCTRDGFTWATDGRILIKVPEIPNAPEPVGKYPPILGAVWDQFDPSANFQPLPPLPEPKEEGCVCPKCNGLGEVYCLSCDNYNDCRKCNGTGQIADPRWTRIDGAAFKVSFLHKIAALPNPRFAIMVRGKVAKSESDELRRGSVGGFVCDGGGEGLLMSLSDDNILSESNEWKPGEVVAS